MPAAGSPKPGNLLFLQGVSPGARKPFPWFDMQSMYVHIDTYDITSIVFHVKHFATPAAIEESAASDKSKANNSSRITSIEAIAS